MMTDQEIKALVERLRQWAEDPMWADHVEVPKAVLRMVADAIEALRAERDQQTKEINALLVAAASKGEEPDLMLSEWRNALARAERAEEAFEIAKAHRDRLESAARRQIQNIEHWLETSEPASPEESRSIYEQLKAALSGSSDPRKDVARRCVEIAQFHPNSVIGKLISEKIASEFSLDTKEGTDAGE